MALWANGDETSLHSAGAAEGPTPDMSQHAMQHSNVMEPLLFVLMLQPALEWVDAGSGQAPPTPSADDVNVVGKLTSADIF